MRAKTTVTGCAFFWRGFDQKQKQEGVQRHCGCDVLPPPKSLQNGFFCAVEIDPAKPKLIGGTPGFSYVGGGGGSF